MSVVSVDICGQKHQEENDEPSGRPTGATVTADVWGRECGGGSVGEGEGERDIDTQRCGRDGHGIS